MWWRGTSIMTAPTSVPRRRKRLPRSEAQRSWSPSRRSRETIIVGYGRPLSWRSRRSSGLRRPTRHMELNELRAKAVEAFLKGRFAKAAKLYTDYCKADPHNLQARLRMGDAWEKSGNRERAIEAYRSAAEEFARDGFLPRAIAASKLVLELDPDHEAMQRLLADLYGRRDKEPEALPRHKPSEGVASAAPEAVGYPAPVHIGYLTRFNEVALPDPDADPAEGTSSKGQTGAPSTPAAAGANSVGAKPAIAGRARALASASESEQVAPPRDPADDWFTELQVDLSLELPPELQM